MRCPNCSTESSGAYCPECGTALTPARCPSCDAQPPANARFCTQCGVALHAARSGSARMAWSFAGVALVVLVGVLLWRETGARPAPGAPAVAPLEAAGAAPGPLTGTPREQADRLFNRVMQELEQGDTARAAFFAPMAIQAYEMAGDLDTDGLFHLSLIQTIGGDAASGRATAERILAGAPDHLLALVAAAQAAEAAGDDDAARGFYRRLLSVYEAEAVKPLPEYQDHAGILPAYRAEAEARAGS